MSKRPVVVFALAAGAAALTGCVVVPEHPHAGYGHGPGYGAVHVVPAPVVVVSPRHPPRHRHHRHHPRRW